MNIIEYFFKEDEDAQAREQDLSDRLREHDQEVLEKAKELKEVASRVTLKYKKK